MDVNDFELNNTNDIVNYFRSNNKEKKIISIENSISLKALSVINDFFIDNKGFDFFLSIDYSDDIPIDYIKHLEVFKYLVEIEKIAIYISGVKELTLIDELTYLKNINSISLGGNYKKTISLKPIENFKELEELELNWGLNKAQQIIVNDFKKLKKLNIRTIDLTSFEIKQEIEKLRVDYSVKQHLKLKESFPNLKYLSLSKCREIEDLSFLDSLSSLEELSLNYMPQLIVFPNLQNHKNLKKLELLEVRNLNEIRNILNFSTLEKLAITRIKGLKAKDFEVFSNLKHLNTLYADFEDNNEREKFEELSQKNNWINSMLNF